MPATKWISFGRCTSDSVEGLIRSWESLGVYDTATNESYTDCHCGSKGGGGCRRIATLQTRRSNVLLEQSNLAKSELNSLREVSECQLQHVNDHMVK